MINITDKALFIEKFDDYLVKNTFLKKHYFSHTWHYFDGKNSKTGKKNKRYNLNISLFPKGIRDDLFNSDKGNNFIYSIQFCDEMISQRTIQFVLYSNGVFSKEHQKFRTTKLAHSKSLNSPISYNARSNDFVAIHYPHIPEELKNIPEQLNNTVDLDILFSIIFQTFELMYDDFQPYLEKEVFNL